MWTTGDRVLGRRGEDNYWYAGTVRHIDGERCYVIFDDGEDALLAPAQLLPVRLQTGDAVWVRSEQDSTYKPAGIVAMKGDEICVRYDSGAEEWVRPARLRLQPGARRQAPKAAPRWAVGDHVLACWHDLFWYPGAVLAVEGDSYHVCFDDGNQALVTADRLRPLEIDAGARVQGRWKGGPEFYPGEITSRQGEVIHVQYDDGDEETTLLRLVRLERDEWFGPGELAGVAQGDRVLACWHDLNWYPGVVVSVNGKRIHILFDDGDQALVTPDRIRALAFRAGDRVCCRKKGGPFYSPGEITRINGEVIHVAYDDGEEEVTSIRLVRVEREGPPEAE
jgi:hypothetical protein